MQTFSPPAALRLLRRGRSLSGRSPLAGACFAVARPSGAPVRNVRAAAQRGPLDLPGSVGTAVTAGMLDARRSAFVASAVAERSSAPSAAPEIDFSKVDLPTSDQSEALLKIRHTVRRSLDAWRSGSASQPRVLPSAAHSSRRAAARARLTTTALSLMLAQRELCRRSTARAGFPAPGRAYWTERGVSHRIQTAHVLAMAVQRVFKGAQVTIGPW